MKQKLYAAIVGMMMLFCATAAMAAEPIDIKFTKSGGGQFIYCNNPEFVTEADLSSDENPKPVYLMKQEGLRPGKYSVFFCQYNNTDFDLEPDIEFVSNNATITINSIGYYLPHGYDYWDCLGAWADYRGLNIRTIDGLSQYVPYRNIDLPQTFKLKNSNEWINKYIYNYNSVSPHVTFNMLVDFTIEKGTADVNFAMLKSYGKLGDRTHHSSKALQSPYKNDTAIKGIEKETLPRVEAVLDVNITSKDHDGNNLPVKVYNQYFPSGNVYDYWMTNINPNRDAYAYSKECSTGSDMLEFEFTDNSKTKYYGSGISQSNRNNVWHFDIYHHNTTAYEPGVPSKSAAFHVPNDELPKKLDIKNPPNLDYEFNLGNFGVTNRYYLNVTNSDSRKRSINYYLEASFSSCIVEVKDKDENLLNPYTLTTENAYAISKGIKWEKVKDYMFSAMLNPGESREFIIDVTLPTNCYGGIVNGLTADSTLKCNLGENTEITEFAQKDELYPNYYNTWFDGYQSMKWEDGELYFYDEAWKKIILPEETRQVFDGRTKDIRITKTAGGYIARFAGYDGYGRNISDSNDETELYILDDGLNYEKTLDFPEYISECVYADGVTYIKSDKIYETKNGVTFTPSNLTAMPVSNGKSVMEKRSDGWYLSKNGVSEKVNFELYTPDNIYASDGTYYIIRSLKNYDTDFNTANTIAVSTDGINYRNLELPNRQLKFMRVDSIGNNMFAIGRNEFEERNTADFSGGVVFKTADGYLSLGYVLESFDENVCMDINYLADVFGIEVENSKTSEDKLRITAKKNDKAVSFIADTNALYSGDESRFVGTAPHSAWGTVYVPFKDFMELLGYEIIYDKAANEVSVTLGK